MKYTTWLAALYTLTEKFGGIELAKMLLASGKYST